MHKESHFQLAVLQQAMACMYYWRTHNKRGGVVVAVNAYASNARFVRVWDGRAFCKVQFHSAEPRVTILSNVLSVNCDFNGRFKMSVYFNNNRNWLRCNREKF